VRENLGPRQMQREHVDDNVTLNRRQARGRGTQVCRYKIPLLKKAITRMRREKKVKRSVNHPPVGSMKAPDVIDYLYDTASALHWNWSTVISGPEKKRVSKKCREAPGTGRSKIAPKQILPKRVTKLSSWQQIVKEVFQDRQFNEGTNYSFQEKMNEAKRRYRAQKAGQAQSAAQGASARRTAALPKFQKRKPGKRSQDTQERAQMAALGLPTQFTGRGKKVRANPKCPDKHEHEMPDGSYMCGKQHGGGKKKDVVLSF
jgi:hypothetical protein